MGHDSMGFDTLDQWLAWQEQLHPSEIDLGLERIAEVYHRLSVETPIHQVITVAGTNGKGSSVAMLDGILRAAGYRVGSYTSPHLLRYNERIVLNGVEVDDQTLCDAFERVDQARGEVSLSYFEFGTLAALDIFNRSDLDVIVLEVGLGGRLDAVNIIDPDVALITNIGIDHQEWLGHDLESIGFEKAGIMRAERPAVFCADEPPHSLVQHAESLNTPLFCFGRDFTYQTIDSGWRWQGQHSQREALPMPTMRGAYQQQNAAGVLMALECLKASLSVSQAAVRSGLLQAQVMGRFQIFSTPLRQILDVGHNPHAVKQLKANLQEMSCLGRTRAVFAMMEDKDIAGVIDIIQAVIDHWYIGDLDMPRAASKEQLLSLLTAQGVTEVSCGNSIASAYRQAIAESGPADQIVVFGSFFTIAAVMKEMKNLTLKQDEQQPWNIIASNNA